MSSDSRLFSEVAPDGRPSFISAPTICGTNCALRKPTL